MWGEHGLGAEKRFPYTQSVQIPLLMRWPGRVAAGTTDGRLVANVDILPTVLQSAGISPDPAYPEDGVSLLTPGARSRLLLEYWRSPDGGPPGWASIRTPIYQYIEWYADDGVTRTATEYYDLVGDPWQLQNLLTDGDPSNDPNVSALSSQLALDRQCLGAACSPTGAPDTASPTAPTGLQPTARSGTRVDLSWNPSTDDRGVTGYAVLRDGAHIGTSGSAGFVDTTVTRRRPTPTPWSPSMHRGTAPHRPHRPR
jgi:hypothetical protein